MMRNIFIITITVVAIVLVGQPAFAYYWIHHTTLVLIPIPRNIEQGYHMTFSGKLLTSDDKTPLPNRTIFIQFDSPYQYTRTLTSATTDTMGNFEVSWTTMPKGHSGGTYYIFAKFNGDDGNFWSISNQFPLNVIPK
jgi:hypothetical protein